jgi:Immunity protein 40
MSAAKAFQQFIRSVGRPMSEVNVGSSEIAVPLDRVAEAVDLLKGSSTAILGGDLITNDERGQLRYAYGSWTCEAKRGESAAEFCERSYQAARDYCDKVRKLHPQSGYLVFVTSDRC